MNGTKNIDINTNNNELREEVVIVCKDQNRKKEKNCRFQRTQIRKLFA